MSSYNREEEILEARSLFDQAVELVLHPPSDATAYSLEKSLFARMLALGLVLLRVFFGERARDLSTKEAPGPDAAALPRERQRSATVLTVFGKLQVGRWWYRLDGGPGAAPLDAETNLPERCHSHFFQEIVLSLAVHQPFEKVVEFLEKLLGRHVSARSIEQISRDAASDYDAFYRGKAPAPPETRPELRVVGLDGKGVPVVKETPADRTARLSKGEKRQSKREALVGVAYDIEPHRRTSDEVVASLMDAAPGDPAAPRAENPRYLASLARPKPDVVAAVADEWRKRIPETGCETVCLVDGAWGLIHLARKHFPEATLVLDIIHALEYLWTAAHVFHAEGSREAAEWVRERLSKVLRGEVPRVVQGLSVTLAKSSLSAGKRKTLERVAGYLGGHREMMRYDEYLAKGYPIGTGVIESACGHVVKARMEGSGMRWTVAGAEAMLLLRSVSASGDWEEYLAFHRDREGGRLYGKMNRGRDWSPLSEAA